MREVVIPGRQFNVETNLRFSRDHRRFGPPPGVVRIGSEVRVVFERPTNLVDTGVHCEPWLVKMLVRNVPGFKRIAW